MFAINILMLETLPPKYIHIPVHDLKEKKPNYFNQIILQRKNQIVIE